MVRWKETCGKTKKRAVQSFKQAFQQTHTGEPLRVTSHVPRQSNWLVLLSGRASPQLHIRNCRRIPCGAHSVPARPLTTSQPAVDETPTSGGRLALTKQSMNKQLLTLYWIFPRRYSFWFFWLPQIRLCSQCLMAIANRHGSVGKLVGYGLSAEQPCFDSSLFNGIRR